MRDDSTRDRPKKETLADFFARSPLRGLKIERLKEIARPPDLGEEPDPPPNPWRNPQK